MKKRVVVLARKSYGAFEMKEFIGKATLRSFAVTMSLLALVPMVFIAVQASVTPPSITLPPPIINVTIADRTTTVPLDEPRQQKIARPQSVGGIAKDGGTYVPVADVPVEVEIGHSQSSTPRGEGGTEEPGINSGIAPTLGGEIPPAGSSEPDEGTYIEVEQEPVLNYNQLRQNLHYPDLARRSGLEGSVLLRVIVGIDGKPVAGNIRVI